MRPPKKKCTVVTLKKKKKAGVKISAVTAYDYPSAKVASDAGIDLILVGDSLGMVVQGNHTTLRTSLDEMVYHTRLVAAAQPHSLVVADMPFGSFHINPQSTVSNAIRFIKEGGAEAVKLEGGKNRYKSIESIINAEIPVLGHLGLTPQSVHRLGGFKTQGKLKQAAEVMVREAKELEKIGVFAIVLEAIPQEVGKWISDEISIPTIGIGAGKHCDGQILVFHDLLGFTNHYLPSFVRQYANVYETAHSALTNYIEDIHSGTFPSESESFQMKKKNPKGDNDENN